MIDYHDALCKQAIELVLIGDQILVFSRAICPRDNDASVMETARVAVRRIVVEAHRFAAGLVQ